MSYIWVWLLAMLVLLDGLSVFAETDAEFKPRLEKLAITGNKTVSKMMLKSLMVTQAKPWYTRFPWQKKPVFDADVFRLDVQRVQAHYRDQGFYAVQIDTVVDRVQVGEARLTLSIVEGSPVHIDHIKLESPDGVSFPDSVAIVANLQTQPGRRLIRSLLEQDRQHILNVLQNRGHAFASASVELAVIPDEHRADVKFQIITGPDCVFGDVRIEGNKTISAHTVQKGLTFREGQAYRKRILQTSQRQLYRSGAFRSVALAPPDTAVARKQVPIVVSVNERPTKSLKMGMGIGNEEWIRGMGILQHRNFAGGARQLTVQASASFLEAQSSVGLRQPYFGSSRTWLTVNGFVKHENPRTYSVNRVGGTVSVEQNLSNQATLVASVTTEFVNFRADSALTQVRLAYHTDTRDDLFDPQVGYLLSLSVEESGRLFRSDREYVRVIGEGRWYHRMSLRHVFAFRILSGVLRRIKGREDPLEFKRFYSGGSNSVRGWGLNQLTLHDPAGLPVGGQSLLEGSLEYRPRLTSTIGAALFLDGGNVGRRYGAFRLRDLLWSTGAGIRYMSPLGPIRVDVAYRLSNDPFAGRRWRFYFSLGQMF